MPKRCGPCTALGGEGAIVSQATGVIVGDKGKQPDIMVRVPRAAPLVIEAEFFPPAASRTTR